MWVFVVPLILSLILAVLPTAAIAGPEKEFLTDAEISKIQEIQEIDGRIKIYLDAAALRLRSAQERLTGHESKDGDPLELFTPEDMLDGYNRIYRSVMYNLDDVLQKPNIDWERLGKALKNLKGSTESAGKELEILKKIAEEQKKEELWNLVNQAIDITNGAREGAELGLAKRPPSSEKGRNRK
jgi:hypothetical protein